MENKHYENQIIIRFKYIWKLNSDALRVCWVVTRLTVYHLLEAFGAVGVKCWFGRSNNFMKSVFEIKLNDANLTFSPNSDIALVHIILITWHTHLRWSFLIYFSVVEVKMSIWTFQHIFIKKCFWNQVNVLNFNWATNLCSHLMNLFVKGFYVFRVAL